MEERAILSPSVNSHGSSLAIHFTLSIVAIILCLPFGIVSFKEILKAHEAVKSRSEDEITRRIRTSRYISLEGIVAGIFTYSIVAGIVCIQCEAHIFVDVINVLADNILMC